MGDDFSVALLAGAFLLASWVDSRAGDKRPTATKARLYHALAGLIVLQLSVGALYVVHDVAASQPLFLSALLTVFLPALVYALVAGLWVLRAAAELGRSLR